MSDDGHNPSVQHLSAQGDRLRVDIARHSDIAAYRQAMTRSSARIGRWNPVNPDDLVHHLAAQSDKHRTFLIRADEEHRVGGDPHGLVGCVNVSNVVQGRFMSATMGYNAFDPYVGTGMFREGLALVVGVALGRAPGGMGLHRIEANVRIGNDASAGVLRSLGFRRERTVRRMLWLADGVDGPSAWRDHDSFAVTREEWPARPYAENDAPAGVIVLGAETNVPFAVAVARELGAVALFDVRHEEALTIAQHSGAPVVWCASERADEGVSQLLALGVRANRARLAPTTGPTSRAATREALRLRPLLK